MTRSEALLRGPLIPVALSRVFLVPFYFLCAIRASDKVRKLWPRLSRHSQRYVSDAFLLAGSMWVFALLSVLLAWLFFSRRRAFPPLIIYFCCLFALLLVCIYVHV